MIQVKDPAKPPTRLSTAPTTVHFLIQMSIVPGLRDLL